MRILIQIRSIQITTEISIRVTGSLTKTAYKYLARVRIRE